VRFADIIKLQLCYFKLFFYVNKILSQSMAIRMKTTQLPFIESSSILVDT